MDALKDLLLAVCCCFRPKLSRWISTDADAKHTTAMHKLAFALNKRLADDARMTGGGNLVFSPLSIYAALPLAAAGARGRTLDEMLRVLGASSRDGLADYVRSLAEQALADRSQTGGPHVMSACGVWHDETSWGLRPAYRDAAVEWYKAETRAVDFRGKPAEAANQINGWVAARTNNIITGIIEPGALSDETGLVLANAIYFKGKWARRPFDKKRTKEYKFRRLDGSTVADVPFMRTIRRQRIACHDGFKVLQLHYERGNNNNTNAAMPAAAAAHALYSMCIFLPDERRGLWPLVDKIARTPEFLRRHLPTGEVLVGDVRLPRFKVDFSSSMTGVLRELGHKEALDDEKADLSDLVVETDGGVSGRRRLVLQEILHKAVIEVNEEGTEAAAVAADFSFTIECGLKPPPPPLVDFVADHPFAFYVIEEVSGAILFAGHVLDPSS